MTTLPSDWIEHRRGDGELIGWMQPHGEGFRVFDLLGRPLTTAPIEWLDAEEMLDARGIGYLADKWMLRLPDAERPVRIAEASPARIIVVADEFGAAQAVGANPDRFEVAWPLGDDLYPA